MISLISILPIISFQLCSCHLTSWTHPPQVFTSVHYFIKNFGSIITISSPLFQNNLEKMIPVLPITVSLSPNKQILVFGGSTSLWHFLFSYFSYFYFLTCQGTWTMLFFLACITPSQKSVFAIAQSYIYQFICITMTKAVPNSQLWCDV